MILSGFLALELFENLIKAMELSFLEKRTHPFNNILHIQETGECVNIYTSTDSRLRVLRLDK